MRRKNASRGRVLPRVCGLVVVMAQAQHKKEACDLCRRNLGKIHGTFCVSCFGRLFAGLAGNEKSRKFEYLSLSVAAYEEIPQLLETMEGEGWDLENLNEIADGFFHFGISALFSRPKREKKAAEKTVLREVQRGPTGPSQVV